MPDTQAEPIEIEAKFSVPDASILARLAKQSTTLPGYRFGAADRKEVIDLYLDTPDYRLLRMGYQLRTRIVEEDRRVTLKTREVGSDIGIYRRLEIEEPLANAALPASAGDLPEAIVDALAGVVGKSQPLVVMCVLEQTRQTRTVTATARGHKRAETTPLATLSLDEIRIRQHQGGVILARTCEIEIELAPGVDAAELQVLADRFIGEFGLTPSKESKLERALALLSRHPADSPESWQGVRPAMHMAEACRLIWREQFMKLLLNEAGVRFSDDPEYVHDARVAIRRARAAARIYRDYFDPKTIRRFLRHLRKTAQLLGAVRDMDVAIAKLERYRQKSKRKNRVGLQETLNAWRARRSAAFATLIEWLDSAKYADFVADFLVFCRTPDVGVIDMQPAPGKEVTPFQVRHVAPTMLLTNFERVRAYEVWFDHTEAVPVETLHRLRIECKYLRYNLEFMAGLLGTESRIIIELLRKLQDDLGELNDAVVSRQLLLADAADDEATVRRYERDQAKLIDKLSQQLRGDFANFVAEANRLRLCAAIARI